jgi:hypothetical protein
MRAGYPLDTLGLGSGSPKLHSGPDKKRPRQERRGLKGWRF